MYPLRPREISTPSKHARAAVKENYQDSVCAKLFARTAPKTSSFQRKIKDYLSSFPYEAQTIKNLISGTLNYFPTVHTNTLISGETQV